ncbi:ThuA domain-containing protein [Draconibacterium sp. IB214405]|uniref:ThuA domain-containing protein n=1 Tax=Draconibacterium sp. IB214405 TaxID=3097352 RepID=UPI002A10DF9B|nr:ThuA domain-containing protein [Draconibacterium sp. IB214405]MDX8338033.1 ThuA domain-containing protein [Draconibacterium sp. IB214405]
MLNKSPRNLIASAIFILTGLLLLSPKIYAQNTIQNTPTMDGKKVLFVYGGWQPHEPKQSVDVFVPWLKAEGAEVVVSDNLDSYLDEELMRSVDLIIQTWTMGTITNEQERGLLKAIRNGAGLAGWHGGIGDSFRNNTEYQFMVGGQWVAHPGGVIDYSVQITDKNDPVTQGLNDFSMHSEQYYMHIDPNVEVMATTKFTSEYSSWIDECVMPVVWKKYYGKGRVFYSSLGHVMTDFEIPEALEIMKRGIRWAAESKYTPKEKWVSPVYK